MILYIIQLCVPRQAFHTLTGFFVTFAILRSAEFLITSNITSVATRKKVIFFVFDFFFSKRNLFDFFTYTVEEDIF